MSVKLVTDAVGRQEGDDLILGKNDQRMIGEEIGVILHVVAQEEKGTVLALADEIIPGLPVARRIGADRVRKTGFGCQR